MFWTARASVKSAAVTARSLRDRRQKQSEALAYPHAEGEQQGGSNQDQPSLAGGRDNGS